MTGFSPPLAKAAGSSSGGPAAIARAAGSGWSVREFICTAGPDDRPFEERHENASIALVVEGSFVYRAEHGRALLHPGALLLGNPGACYSCGHDHGVGDRCISLSFRAESLAEIASLAGAGADFRFPAPALPADHALLAQRARLAALCRMKDPLLADQDVFSLVSGIIRQIAGVTPRPQRVSPRDERRIGRALRYAEHKADSSLDLDQLAAVASMSRYHFLRVFRNVVGKTPWQYVLGLRLLRVAAQLLASDEPVLRIAFQHGFGDLSTFNAQFRTRFGVTPTEFRAARMRGSRGAETA